MSQSYTLEYTQGYWLGRFKAMASPCELLMDVDEESIARTCTELACNEARRIEHKFSRYRNDNIIYQINQSRGTPVNVDDETAYLLDYAQQCYEISEGMFDVTSGVLREVWRFDGSDNVPPAKRVAKLLPRIGWQNIIWQRPHITVPKGMEIDLGGIGKEYAVDRTAMLVSAQTQASVLINFGGDLFATGARRNGHGWFVGVENPQQDELVLLEKSADASVKQYELMHGAIATSGDARRYLLKAGVRYGHILDPRSGWPVQNAPHSVTVVASTCTEAGILSTLAMLHGEQAEAFLQEQDVTYWSIR